MLATYCDPQKTRLTFQQAHDSLQWALKTHMGHDPSDEVLALALSKSALETGQWRAIWNFNFGNVKAHDQYVGMFTCITLNEVLMRGGKPKVVWFSAEGELDGRDGKLIAPPMAVPPGHHQSRMRAYANHYDGADQYVDFVSRGRYKLAWAALLTGSPAAYVHELKVAGYFTAAEDEYRRGVEALYRQMLQKVKGVEEAEQDQAAVEWDRLKELIPHLQFSIDELLNGVVDEAIA